MIYFNLQFLFFLVSINSPFLILVFFTQPYFFIIPSFISSFLYSYFRGFIPTFLPYSCSFIPTFLLYFTLLYSNLRSLSFVATFLPSFFCYTLVYSKLPFFSLQHSNLPLLLYIILFKPSFLIHHCFHYKKNYNLSFLFFVVLFQPTFVLLCHILTFLSCSSFFKSMQAFFLILCSFISTPTLIFPLNLYPFLSLLLIAKFSSLKTAEGNELLTFFHRIGSVDQPLCTGAIPFINIGILCKLKPGIPWFNEFILIILWLVWFGLV